MIGAVLVGIALLVRLNELSGAQTYGIWNSPDGEWSAQVKYKRKHLVTGPTSVSVWMRCEEKRLTVRAKLLGYVNRPAAIESPPGFVSIDSERFTIGPGFLYGEDVEAFVFEAPNCEEAVAY